ncbi:MAG: hypothetical protein J6S85_10010 [Methanobrevibacter sp.]|nr:hypothetical protein [Methanobrevibacter sp.]
MLPSIKDLAMYVNKKLTELDWNNNFQKIVNWLTSGNTDIKVKSVEISQDGGLINNGSLTQSGDLSVAGNISTNGNLTVDGIISGDGSGLTGVISSAQVSYTPFTVNSGNTDVNGKGDLFDYTADVSTSIQFKVGGSYKSITFTNAKGKTTTLEAINSYDLSQTDNGTYLVYLTENATAVTLSDNGAKIYRQPTAPTSPSATDIWLDTSTEGLKSYIRQSGTWVEANIVPLGFVVVNNQKVQSATTYVYNWNGYNVVLDCPSLQTNNKPVVVVKMATNTNGWYMLFSNGYCMQGGQATCNSTKTFPIAFKDTNYYVVGTIYNNGANEAVAVYNKTTTSFSFGSENNVQVYWFAYGYAY